MKTIIDSKRINFIRLLILIFVCEMMLNTNNTIIQSIGACIVPIIIINSILIIKKEEN